jgi:hypothetical protein
VLLSKDELEFGFLTNQLTGPLTLLDCLDRFQPALASRESLVIHLVGATVFEMIAMIKWECKLPFFKSIFQCILSSIRFCIQNQDRL